MTGDPFASWEDFARLGTMDQLFCVAVALVVIEGMVAGSVLADAPFGGLMWHAARIGVMRELQEKQERRMMLH